MNAAPSPTAAPTREPFRPSGRYVLAGVLSWLIPGAGHWLLGKRGHAVVLAVFILGLFWAGELLAVTSESPLGPARPIAVSWQVSSIFFVCQAGNGLSTLSAQYLWGAPRYPNETQRPIDDTLPRHLGLGILLTSVSGLLNFLVILHVLDPRTWGAHGGAALLAPAPAPAPTSGGRRTV